MNKCTITGKSMKIDTDIILHILCHLPEIYEGVVQELGMKLKEHPDVCTLQLIRKRVILRYEKMNDFHNQKDNLQTDRALAEIAGGLENVALVAFITCFKCTHNQRGLYGHKEVDCNKRTNNKDRNAEKQQYDEKLKSLFKGGCWYCGASSSRRLHMMFIFR